MLKSILGALVALVIMPSPAAAQATASAQGQAEVEIVSPISIAHIDQTALRFGTLVVRAAGTVQISGPGNVNVSSGIDVVGGFQTLDGFTVTGEPGRNFSVLAIGGGGTVQSVDDQMTFTVEFPGGTSGYILNAQGVATVAVGGTLSVNLGQRPGAYTGQYTVSATYE